jgi:hypothetical protein
MEDKIRLYWRRETGCDVGVELQIEDLDVAIRPRVLELAREIAETAQEGDGPVELRLPFLDKREWRRRAETLRGVTLRREGRVIIPEPPNATAALRNIAADTAGAHPAWLAAPVEREPGYFRVWRHVSVALQEFLRRKAAEAYFRDAAAFEDRKAAWPLLVYQAMRPCYGVPETEFTYDVADAEMLDEALRMIRRPLQENLAKAQARLAESGRAELSRRYAPAWHEDVLRAVREKPGPLLSLLGDEAMVVDAVIALGATRDPATVKPFTRRLTAKLRCFYGLDLRDLAVPILEEATRALEDANARFPRRALSKRAAAKQALEQRALDQNNPGKETPTIKPKRRPLPISSLPPAARDPRFGAASTYGRYKPDTAAFR